MKLKLLVVGVCGLSWACGSPSTTPGDGGGGTPPLALSVSCPAAVTIATANASVAVTYASPATTGGTQPVSATCSPASGSLFPRGAITAVTCNANDSAGKTASCNFAVTVQSVPLLKGTNFFAFGDSFTAGEVLNAFSAKVVSDAKSYPTQLRSLLIGRYVSQDVIMNNYGLSGETLLSDTGDRDEDTRLRFIHGLASVRPQAVLLLEGVNDLGASTDDQIVGVLRQMVQEAYSQAGVKVVYLATEPPEIPGLLRSANAARIPGLNAKIRVAAQQEGATLVDLYAAMIGNVNGLINSDDGLHPYPAGYVVMAETFFAAIKNTFEQPASSGTASK